MSDRGSITRSFIEAIGRELGVPVLERLEDIKTEISIMNQKLDGMVGDVPASGYSRAMPPKLRVLSHIRRAGRSGIARSMLTRKTPLMNAATRNALIEELQRDGLVKLDWARNDDGRIQRQVLCAIEKGD